MFPARYGEGVAGSLGGGLAGIALVTFLAFLFQASLQPFVSLSGWLSTAPFSSYKCSDSGISCPDTEVSEELWRQTLLRNFALEFVG